MNTLLFRIMDSDELATAIGAKLAEVLELRQSQFEGKPHFNTLWGCKSVGGLARVVAEIVRDADKQFPSPDSPEHSEHSEPEMLIKPEWLAETGRTEAELRKMLLRHDLLHRYLSEQPGVEDQGEAAEEFQTEELSEADQLRAQLKEAHGALRQGLSAIHSILEMAAQNRPYSKEDLLKLFTPDYHQIMSVVPGDTLEEKLHPEGFADTAAAPTQTKEEYLTSLLVHIKARGDTPNGLCTRYEWVSPDGRVQAFCILIGREANVDHAAHSSSIPDAAASEFLNQCRVDHAKAAATI